MIELNACVGIQEEGGRDSDESQVTVLSRITPPTPTIKPFHVPQSEGS